jgi:hypothetical protein
LGQKQPLITNTIGLKEYPAEFYITISIAHGPIPILNDSESNDVLKLQLKLPAYPTTVEDLRLIRFWLRELSRPHFHFAYTEAYYFLNPDLVRALFPNENIFLSFSLFSIENFLLESMMRSIATLIRVNHLRINTLSCGIKTLFNELLLVSKHGIGKLRFAISVFDRPSTSLIPLFHPNSSSDLIKVLKILNSFA